VANWSAPDGALFFYPVRFFVGNAMGIDEVAEQWLLIDRYPKWCMPRRWNCYATGW
jgi:hypothetical protein